MTITTKFDIRDKVKILNEDLVGRIIQVIIDGEGIIYRIAYWYNGECKTVNLWEDEIAKECDR